MSNASLSGPIYSAAVNLIANGLSFSEMQAAIDAAFPQIAGASWDAALSANETAILDAAGLPQSSRPYPYLLNEAFQLGNSTVTYGPNLVANPLGPYASGGWTPTHLTETTGQTDPTGGTNASLLADTATSTQHYSENNATVALVSGSTYRIQFSVEPGTYAGVVCVQIGGIVDANFDLTALTGSSSGSTPATNFSMTPIGATGYYLCTCQFVAPTTTSEGVYLGMGASLGSYLGTGANFDFYKLAIQLAY
jgi:hypothetical protein